MLTRYSPANRPKRTCYFFTAARLQCAGAPTLAVGVTPPHTGEGGPTVSSLPRWGFCCTEWVNGPSHLSLQRERSCFDPRESGVIWPSSQAGLDYGVRLPRSRHCLGFRRKGHICRPSAHTTTAVLNLPRPRKYPDLTASGKIWTLCSIL